MKFHLIGLIRNGLFEFYELRLVHKAVSKKKVFNWLIAKKVSRKSFFIGQCLLGKLKILKSGFVKY